MARRVGPAGRDLPVHRDASFRECDYGVWTRRPVAEIDAERARRIFAPFPGGESYAEVAARTRDLASWSWQPGWTYCLDGLTG